MDESRVTESTATDPAGSVAGEPGASVGRSVQRTVIWAVVSVAFLGFLAFGSVQARIWRFGELEIESKSIFGIWRVQAQSLPDVSNRWLLELVFNGSAIVVVLCVILLMRYLLLEAGEELAPPESEPS